MSKSSRRRTVASSPTTVSSHSPSGTPRAGRRERARPLAEPPFLERHRNLLLGGAAVVAIAIVAGFFLFSAVQPSYACGTEFQGSTSGDAARLGAPQPDMGREHVQPGQKVRYAYCPPASGSHINRTGEGPVQARFYGPGDVVGPQGWIHNLEHGSLVLLYRCDGGAPGCDPANQAAMKAFQDAFPNSPVCNVPRGRIGPVVARFEDMPSPYAALVWDRVLYLDTLDTQRILDFYATEGERGNPEPQCNPTASPSPAASPSPTASPSASPSVPPVASPSAVPSPSPSPSPS